MSLTFINNIFTMLERHPGLTITMDWNPGHAKVIGNEAVDSAAKDARLLPGIKHTTSTHLRTKTQRRPTSDGVVCANSDLVEKAS